MTILRLRGTLLPTGETRQLWILGDRLTFDRPAGECVTVSDGGFLLPGLVDAHAHAGHGDGMVFDPALLAEDGAAYAAAGTAVLRMPGHTAPVPAPLRTDVSMPRLITAGAWLAWPGLVDMGDFQIRTADLPATAVAQARANDGWCKVYGDWEPFTSAVPQALLRDVADAVHAAGYRVAAHCQTADGVRNAVLAGIDSIEHGWFLDADLVDALAARGGAFTPTGAQFVPLVADVRDHRPAGARRDWFLSGAASLAPAVVAAHEAGVRLLAGTDATRYGDLVGEVEWLVGAGLPGPAAVEAASWGAREYLGLPGLVEGAPADVVVYPADPRVEPAVLRHPTRVVLRGRVVQAAGGGTR